MQLQWLVRVLHQTPFEWMNRDTKRTDWNSGLITARGSPLRDYANRNICLICGPDSPNTAPYTHNATPDNTITHVDQSFKTYWTAPTSSEWTGLHSRLALMTDSRAIPW
jgi:hypothetical protein